MSIGLSRAYHTHSSNQTSDWRRVGVRVALIGPSGIELEGYSSIIRLVHGSD